MMRNVIMVYTYSGNILFKFNYSNSPTKIYLIYKSRNFEVTLFADIQTW